MPDDFDQALEDWGEFCERYGRTINIFRARWQQMFGRAPTATEETQYNDLRLTLQPPPPKEGEE